MKIITWNIGEDERNEQGRLDFDSYKYIIHTIEKENIDVICLQEAIIKSDYLPSIANYIKKYTALKYNIEYELSDSHINIGCKMGVVICSKYQIDKYEFFLLDNPHFVRPIDDNTIYYSHDKGFIIAEIKGINIITGHCLPFHVFKENPLEYLNIYEKADDKFVSVYAKNNKLVLCGDFNYSNVSALFPKSTKNLIDAITCPTRKDKQLDHFLISKSLSCRNKSVVDNCFDHKYGIFEID